MMNAVLTSLSDLLNYFLIRSETAKYKAGLLEGKIFIFSLLGINLKLKLIFEEAKIKISTSHDEDKSNVFVEAFPSEFIFVLMQGMEYISSENILFKGEVSLLNDLVVIMKSLRPEIYNIVEPIFGRVIATEVANLAEHASRYQGNFRRTFKRSLEEYLKEEAQIIPTDFELEEFYNAVNQLRDKTEVLSSKIVSMKS
jgi:ubiquinone biosynthesis protein UbiJ